MANRIDTPAQDLIVRDTIRQMVQAAGLPGLPISEIRVVVQCTEAVCRRHLRTLESMGQAESTFPIGGRLTAWGVPGIFAAASAKLQARRDACAARAAVRKQQAEYLRRMKQRTVPAAKAPKLRTRAPNSVWQMADMACA